MEQFSLSIVLPVCNVAPSLAAAVAECQAVAAQHTADYELIIADDASTDGTSDLADRLAAFNAPVAVIHYPRRRGYRMALYDAWGAARGTYVAALDLAGPAAAADLARLLPIRLGHAAIFGYRVPPPRRPAEALFATAVAARVAPGLRDPALSLGLFRADLRAMLAPEGPDALTHADLFVAARRQGLSIAQVAVQGKAARTAAPSLADTLAALSQRGTEPAAASPAGRSRQGAAVGAGMLVAAGGLWLLRRWRRHL
ncbi:MAG: glycosyltransferase family 2 protein [Chloroflexales bacterium]|nr:glycosyltransferase family 2 protein [Chloroflexales bacterium]